MTATFSQFFETWSFIQGFCIEISVKMLKECNKYFYVISMKTLYNVYVFRGGNLINNDFLYKYIAKSAIKLAIP